MKNTEKQKTYLPIYLYGAVIILIGFFLLFSEFSTYKTINSTIGITLSIAALLAYFAAYSRHRKQVQFAYHEMHALAMLVYGVSILFFSNNFEKLISFTAFLFIFYSFSEIILSLWLFNLGQRILYKIIFIRFLLGLATGFGTAMAMTFTTYTLQSFGILFALVGLNIMLYVPVMKGNNHSDIHNNANVQIP